MSRKETQSSLQQCIKALGHFAMIHCVPVRYPPSPPFLAHLPWAFSEENKYSTAEGMIMSSEKSFWSDALSPIRAWNSLRTNGTMHMQQWLSSPREKLHWPTEESSIIAPDTYLAIDHSQCWLIEREISLLQDGCLRPTFAVWLTTRPCTLVTVPLTFSEFCANTSMSFRPRKSAASKYTMVIIAKILSNLWNESISMWHPRWGFLRWIEKIGQKANISNNK